MRTPWRDFGAHAQPLRRPVSCDHSEDAATQSSRLLAAPFVSWEQGWLKLIHPRTDLPVISCSDPPGASTGGSVQLVRAPRQLMRAAEKSKLFSRPRRWVGCENSWPQPAAPQPRPCTAPAKPRKPPWAYRRAHKLATQLHVEGDTVCQPLLKMRLPDIGARAGRIADSSAAGSAGEGLCDCD